MQTKGLPMYEGPLACNAKGPNRRTLPKIQVFEVSDPSLRETL